MPGIDPSNRLSAPAVLTILAEALEDLPRRVATIETLAATLAASAPADIGLRRGLQDLDLIRQTIEDLGRLATSAASGDTHSPATLASSLQLEALRNRLTGRTQDERKALEAGADQGRVELFAPQPSEGKVVNP